MRGIVLCADDFGMSDGINAGILELLSLGRLSATTCMTAFAAWPAGARRLSEFQDRASIGLHFNLTEGPSARPLASLMLLSCLRQMPLDRVRQELQRQLDAFEDALGAPPDFIDGHQHVQMFPQIRDAICDVIGSRYAGTSLWVRRSAPSFTGHDAVLKAVVLRSMGSGFEAAMKEAGIAYNESFGGLYALAPRADFAAQMERWLSTLRDGTLVMCHAGLDPAETPLAAVRRAEHAYLASERFLQALQTNGVALVRRPALVSGAEA